MKKHPPRLFRFLSFLGLNYLASLVIKKSNNIIPDIKDNIEQLSIGESFPVCMGSYNHAIVYEITKCNDGKYSFAMLNTGLALDSKDDKVYTNKYLDLSIEDIERILPRMLTINTKNQDILGQYFNLINFRKKFLKRKFKNKKVVKEEIFKQIRGTCAWSSLELWLKRCCYNNDEEDFYKKTLKRLSLTSYAYTENISTAFKDLSSELNNAKVEKGSEEHLLYLANLIKESAEELFY